jgi:hypothetical protein
MPPNTKDTPYVLKMKYDSYIGSKSGMDYTNVKTFLENYSMDTGGKLSCLQWPILGLILSQINLVHQRQS